MDKQNNITNAFISIKSALDEAERQLKALVLNALDIEDEDNSKAWTNQATKSIREIKKMKASLLDIEEGFKPFSSSSSKEAPDPPNESAAEMLAKLRAMSSSGFAFSKTQMGSIMDVAYSNSAFGLPNPFAKSFNVKESLKAQAEDGAYFPEVFVFGPNRLLVSSLWDVSSLAKFNSWLSQQAREEPESATIVGSANGIEKKLPSSNGSLPIPISLSVFGKSYPIKGWGDALIRLCEILISKDSQSVGTFDSIDSLNNGSTFFSYRIEDIAGLPRRLTNGLWVETDRSDSEIMRTCAALAVICGFEPDVFSVETLSDES
ncbi:MAG: hypothetical protein FWG30_11145 [Eubacteriaceae bacterium]|nr:hypothetical protein [Eubacteriaceae bacterium]